jgi:pyruvate/2-oxoglutarate/acetoin dehydrogenase E1 component
MHKRYSYAAAILDGFEYLLHNHPDVFVIGQGLWSPWYVGASMSNLDARFGRQRVIDSPVSEAAVTGAALGASLCGYRPIVVHPRVDFMLVAMDPIVNQAAKWSSMLGGQAHPAITIRGIVNRGGEQGAQHSQALHSWFAHVPGLRVVMPATPSDARDLLIAATLCNDPVLYIDDRWLYSEEAELPPAADVKLSDLGPQMLRAGSDVTLVGSSFSTKLCLDAAKILEGDSISAEVIDLRVIAPLDIQQVIDSVVKTQHLVAVDGGWSTCGLASEVIAGVVESSAFKRLKAPPARVTLPHAPAPTSAILEQAYYPTSKDVARSVRQLLQVSAA